MKHKHHIIPIHRGGTDHPSNIVELTVEQHARAHWVEWMLEGHWQDRVAWQGLAGMISHEEAIRESQSAPNRGDKNPSKRPEVREKNRLAHLGKKQSAETIAKKSASLKGKRHPQSEETKKKIGEANKISCLGERNSQYGTIWVNDGVKAFKVPKYIKLPAGIKKGRKL